MPISVQVQLASRVAGIPAPAQLRKWVGAALAMQPAIATASIVVRIVNRAEGRRLNHAYRRKDYATNVLTFGYGAGPLGVSCEADIILCAQVIASEARDQGKPLAAHYAHLTVHGVLHARGLDHETLAEARRMEAREVEILGKLGFAHPYES